MTRRGDAWVTAHSGEISAWFIAKLGWADISCALPHRVVGEPMAPLGRVPSRGAVPALGPAQRGVARRWRCGLDQARLVVANAPARDASRSCVLLALPWQLTAWRPALPPTWVEPAVAELRLGVAAILMARSDAR